VLTDEGRLITIANQEQPPRRFIAGADAIAIAEQKAKDLQEQANAHALCAGDITFHLAGGKFVDQRIYVDNARSTRRSAESAAVTCSRSAAWR
jgi:hypothetical protein